MPSLPMTPLCVGPGPESLMVWAVHLTSVWVVCHTHSSRNPMLSSWCICLVDFHLEGHDWPPAAQSPWPHHSQAAAGVSSPVSGFNSRRASCSQLHLSRTETMRRGFPSSSLPPLSTSVYPMLEPTPSIHFSSLQGVLRWLPHITTGRS